MRQAEPTKIQASWNTLFIGRNPKIVRDLAPIISRFVGVLNKQEFQDYPQRHELLDLLSGPELHACFLDVASDVERGLGLIPDLLRQNARLPVIAILPAGNSDLVLRCLRQGATDFLIAPFTEEHVEATVQKVARVQPARSTNAGRAKVISVMPAKGGCGASTIACNLAYQWKRLGSKNVLLADLDPLAGTLSFVLKIKSSYSFMDALQRSHEMDTDLWKAMVVARQGIDVLLAPEVMIESVTELTDANSVIDYARTAYDTIILDSNGVYGDWNLAQATNSDEILLVTTNELMSLQAVQRALTYLDANGIGRWKIKIIVNRYDKHHGLSREMIGTALHSDIYYFLPSDYEALQKSLMEGKQIAGASSLGKSLIGLADRLAGREETIKKASSISGLMSLFSRTSS